MSSKIPHDDSMTFANAFIVLKEWHAKDTYPWMKWKTVNFISPYLGYLLTSIILIAHLTWAVSGNCDTNFQRGGAMIVLVSAVLFGWIEWHKPETGLLSGGKIKSFEFFAPHVALPFIAILGTLVWGYGDLLPWLNKAGC